MKKAFLELFENTTLEDHIDLHYIIENFDFKIQTEDDLRDEIQERIYEQEIIYYSNAIEYLSKNDSSLRESLELAHEMGADLKALNSEYLATLLFQRNLSNELSEIDFSTLFED